MYLTHIVEIIAASSMPLALIVLYCNRKMRGKYASELANKLLDQGAEPTVPPTPSQNMPVSKAGDQTKIKPMKPPLGGGIDVRQIQFIGVSMLLPIILILALETKITEPVIGTLLGGVAGYLLSSIGAYDLKG